MIFTTKTKQHVSQSKPIQQVQTNTFSSRWTTRPNVRKDVPASSPAPPPTPVAPAKKPMKWGEPTWFLFHTIAEKIKPEHFNEYKNELFEIIKTICYTLPCPDCAKHATEYINKVHFQNIRSKEDLQLLLWSFHNEVNKRKGFALFPFENVNTKYSTANTRNIIQHFIYHHQDKHASFRMIADDLNRARVTNNIRNWFIRHIHFFEE
jgi:hypothetical protein